MGLKEDSSKRHGRTSHELELEGGEDVRVAVAANQPFQQKPLVVPTQSRGEHMFVGEEAGETTIHAGRHNRRGLVRFQGNSPGGLVRLNGQVYSTVSI